MPEQARQSGDSYARQNPNAEKPTPAQIPNYDERTSFGNGMDDAKKN